ncbi:MAG: AI-2E family transporter [Pseudomonadota bacterium]|jgi:putative permease|uniref:AI-2E family transporter n=3 Tax=Vibrio natriegens TaxID=691 RepID=A0AAN0Y3U2_VIBNA|nr:MULTISPECIES: AI-2E family transporter [Vibrio]AEX22849.1 permease PerM [Vibrio sp. EJY3]ALR14897.1 permase [Vibrio natriegens NBRC 15636 = ATCC 14048 = DSM 759]ANQ13239.1 AI-2E family transporter [Vibrio natriegens NBRC 15636 = ATCC 14048 = DSM 759]ANQ17736.1 AI-2E family transporter [Vibrio natriegens]ANQ22303.1 AI-2E family transporter [Vibrio natriegens]
MFEMVSRWYQRRFSDPHAVSLVAILLFGFITIYFFGHLIAPLLVAIVLAYLLEWPVVQMCRMGVPRTLAVIIVLLIFISLMLIALFGLVPTIWTQVGNLINDIPNMYNGLQKFIVTLPERHPELANLEIVETIVTNAKNQALGLGESVVKGSLASLVSLATLAVYLILVPLLIFFLLKDKEEMLGMASGILPKNRRLANKVWHEMNEQISNYIRGKVLEILIVGGVSYVTFAILDLRYSALLAVAVGLSVLIPYIGAAAVTVPVAIVGLFQWGLTPPFYWLLLAYGIIQALDGNVLVPVLFSEAVNLHPVAIIIAVLVFGGLWGFWGVFFAIPLATLVKAVWNALPSTEESEPAEQE